MLVQKRGMIYVSRWGTKRKDKDYAKFSYELIALILVVIAIIYAVATGTAPENTGF